MQIGRTILVALLAVAIAMLPAAMGIATAAPETATVASAQAMPDCEHHRHNKAPSKQKSDEHGTCVVNCALCFGFVWHDANTVAHLVTPSTALTPVLVQSDISSLMGLPPFRPPRA